MKLVNTKYNFEIPFTENEVHIIAIENPEAFSDIARSLVCQVNGVEGEFIFSEKEILYNISKTILLIDNIFGIDCNDKRIISKLFKELTSISTSELTAETSVLTGQLMHYIDVLSERVPYDLTFSDEADFSGILKALDVRLDAHPENLLEEIIEYLRAMRLICGYYNVVFFNLKYFLTVDQLQALYEFCFYEKIQICIIEGIKTEKILYEKYMILDKDLCIIKEDMD